MHVSMRKITGREGKRKHPTDGTFSSKEESLTQLSTLFRKFTDKWYWKHPRLQVSWYAISFNPEKHSSMTENQPALFTSGPMCINGFLFTSQLRALELCVPNSRTVGYNRAAEPQRSAATRGRWDFKKSNHEVYLETIKILPGGTRLINHLSNFKYIWEKIFRAHFMRSHFFSRDCMGKL